MYFVQDPEELIKVEENQLLTFYFSTSGLVSDADLLQIKILTLFIQEIEDIGTQPKRRLARCLST